MVHAHPEGKRRGRGKVKPTLDYEKLFDRLYSIPKYKSLRWFGGKEKWKKIKESWCNFAQKNKFNTEQFKKIGRTLELLELAERFSKRSEIRAFASLLANPNFEIGMLKKFNLILRNADENTSLTFRVLSKIFNNKRFNIRMLDTINLIMGKKKENAHIIFREFDTIMMEKDFDEKKLKRLENSLSILDKANNYTMRAAISIIRFLAENPDVGKNQKEFEKIVSISSKIIRRGSNIISKAMPVYKRLLKNPNFNPEMLDGFVKTLTNIDIRTGGYSTINALETLEELMKITKLDADALKKFDTIFELIVKGMPIKMADKALRSLKKMVSHPKFDVRMLDTIIFSLKKEWGGRSQRYVSSSVRIDEVMAALAVMLRKNEDAHTTILDFEAMYNDTIRYMKEIGVNHTDIIRCINFAYAVNEIGEKKTRELHKKQGIEFFGRYYTSTLEEVYLNLDPNHNASKPLLLAVYSKEDHNGAFYQNTAEFMELSKNYKLIIVETDSEKGVYSGIEKTGEMGEIKALVLGGHGAEHGIAFGKKVGTGELDLTDRKRLASIKKYLAKNPTIVLISCSTGSDKIAVGKMISKVLEATVFAPKKPSALLDYTFDRTGRINGVKFDGPHNIFVNGEVKRK